MNNAGVFTSSYNTYCYDVDPSVFFTSDDTEKYVIRANEYGEAELKNVYWTATYKPGEGSGIMTPSYVTKGESFQLPECTLSPPEGKSFLCWSDGTNTYKAGDTVTMTEDTDYTAQWAVMYDITWKDWDGSTIDTTKELEGVVPTHADPTRKPDDNNSYIFTGWFPTPAAVTGDAEYTATYKTTPRTHSVIVEDTKSGTVTADPGEAAKDAPVTLTVQPGTNAQLREIKAFKKGYIENVNLTAVNGSGGNDNEKHEKLVDGNTNTKWCYESTAGYIIVKADNSFILSQYTLTTANDTKDFSGRNWKKWEIYGANFYDDSEATRDSADWQLVESVENDTVLQAENFREYSFELKSEPQEYQYYKIEVLNNVNGNVTQMSELKLSGFRFDDEVELTQDSTDQTKYTFNMPSADVRVKASFDAPGTITWKNWDGTVLKTDENVPIGTTPEYNGEVPTKQSDLMYDYVFERWAPDIYKVSGNEEYTAVFTAVSETAIPENGSVADSTAGTVYLVSGAEVRTDGGFDIYPDSNKDNLFDGDGSTKLGGKFSDPVSIYFSYSSPFVMKKYYLRTANDTEKYSYRNMKRWKLQAKGENDNWVDLDVHESSSELPATNNRAVGFALGNNTAYKDYRLADIVTGGAAGWEDRKYSFQLSEIYFEISSNIITWKNWDGTILETDTNAVTGKMPEYNGETPTRPEDINFKYTFAGWTPEVSAITGSVEYTAAYTAIPKYRILSAENGVLKIDGVDADKTDFVKLSDSYSCYRLPDGNYLLNSEIVVDRTILIDSGNVMLNIGEYNLTNNNSSVSGKKAGAIIVSGGSFTLQGTTGVIKSQDSELNGSGIYISGGTATMQGGEISGNIGSAAVYADGDFHMSGGRIINNTGFGVDVTYDADIYLSGSAVISGNKDSDGRNCNVYLNDYKRINIEGALADGAKIGVTMSYPGKFTKGYGTYNDEGPHIYFTPDDPSKYSVVRTDSNEAYLGSLSWVASYAPGEGSGKMAPTYIGRNESFTLPKCSFNDPDNKLFLNWTDGQNTYKSGDSCTMTADTVFTAVYADAIMISFDANGGSGTMEKGRTFGNYIMPECTFTPPEGKVFRGWMSDYGAVRGYCKKRYGTYAFHDPVRG